MKRQRTWLVSAWVGAFATAMALPALAQNGSTGMMMAPDYGSSASAGALSNGHFNTPESDGRPGVKFFTYGVQAFRKNDYRHAIDMYKVAASWAYKPAEYNLGVMYFKGQGVPADRARGAAWMVLAAERGNPEYVKVRDMMVTVLTKAQFKRTDEIWGELKKTYGDKVALRRAKAQWARVKSQKTGTRVGGVAGELSVGVRDTGHAPSATSMTGQSLRMTTTAAGTMQSGSIDGSVAYRQFGESGNPYDPIFLKQRSGSVFVEPLQPAKMSDDKAKKSKRKTNGATQPGQPTRNT